MLVTHDPQCVVVELEKLYDVAIESMRADVSAPATYPMLEIRCKYRAQPNAHTMSYCIVHKDTTSHGTVTQPALFRAYFLEQLSALSKRYDAEFAVYPSQERIPVSFVPGIQVKQEWLHLANTLMPDLGNIRDIQQSAKCLSYFDALRVDFSINRLQHYTGTHAQHFQRFVLLTNYHRYVPAFVEYAKSYAATNEGCRVIGPDNVDLTDEEAVAQPTLVQMPAYHLVRPDGNGITLINIGVGPSNAKTITDHLAVLRPHAWLMVGHCGGLRATQKLGDYVLAHSYVRFDHVLDKQVPLWVPVPCLSEIQNAIQQAIDGVTNCEIPARTGAVLTTDDRNWELDVATYKHIIEDSRAIAVDMESATIAANGYRYRVPYGTLLCVSDKPLHGELKLQGMANEFYRKRVRQHLDISIRAMEALRDRIDTLHSKKLRGFDEPLFR